MNLLLGVMALLLSNASVGGLWLCWRGYGRSWLLESSTTGLLALWIWVRLMGPEFGTVYALGAFVLGVWGWIVVTAASARRSVAIDRPLRHHKRSTRSLLSKLGTVILTGPIALTAVMVTCLHVVYWLPGAPGERWVMAAFALPLLWATFVTVLLCVDRRWQATLALSALSGLGAVLLPTGSLS